jgi:hypothetical protein
MRHRIVHVREPLAADTPEDIEERQIARWRDMSIGEKAALVSSLSQTVHDIALAGIRRRYPDATPREWFLRLAMLRLGRELALRAYPEIADLPRRDDPD